MKRCLKCDLYIPNRIKIDDKIRVLTTRKYCLNCSPFKAHNTKQLQFYKDNENKIDFKTCSKCKEKIPKKDFYVSTKKNKLSSWCKKCSNKECQERLTKFKQKCVDYKGSKCFKCNYNACLAALEFHHRNPTEKDFTISHVRRDFKTVKVELDKCLLLCANCHREIHYALVV